MYVKDIAKFQMFNLNLQRARKGIRQTAAPQLPTDTLDISDTGRQMAGGTSRNRQIDQTVDVQSYTDKARAHNQEALANVGDSIKARNADVWQSSYHAFKAALTEKYGKLPTRRGRTTTRKPTSGGNTTTATARGTLPA